MPSLYAQYVTERTNDNIVENEYGFATFRYISDYQIYIIDIYVIPEYRKKGVASELADSICKVAKEKGCRELIGTVNPACKGANNSMLTLIAYGMNLISSSDNAIVFRKEI